MQVTMSLSDREQLLYARQILLPEIGKEGQARLCTARVCAGSGADPRVVAVARDYLERAGVAWGEDGEPVALPDAAAVARLAGDPALADAAAAVLGAFAAVETIKRITGAGAPADFPRGLVL